MKLSRLASNCDFAEQTAELRGQRCKACFWRTLKRILRYIETLNQTKL